MFDHKEVKVQTIISGLETEAQLIALAFRANNVDGPLPPDQQDIGHTVELLLEKKVPKKDIPALLGLPEQAVKKYINDVEARWERAKTYRGYKLVVTQGVSVPEAARQAGTTPEKVRNFIARGRTKVREDNITKVSKEMRQVFKSLTSKLTSNMVSLTKKYDDGDVVAQDVFDLLKSIEASHVRIGKVIKDLHDRFEAKLNTGNGNSSPH